MENDWPYVHSDVLKMPNRLVWTFVHTLIIFRSDEGERALQIAAFSHSGAGLSRLSLRSTQIFSSSVDLFDVSPVSFY